MDDPRLAAFLDEARGHIRRLVNELWDEPDQHLVPTLMMAELGSDSVSVAEISPDDFYEAPMEKILPDILVDLNADEAVLILNEELCLPVIEGGDLDDLHPGHDHVECITLTAVGPDDVTYEVFLIGRGDDGTPYLVDDDPVELSVRGKWTDSLRRGIIRSVARSN